MDNLKKISESVAADGQPTPESLYQAAEAGFKSVVNLRSPDETGFLSDEQQQAEAAGLQYAHIPLNSSKAEPEDIPRVLSEIAGLPEPILFHCGAGMRASALALIAEATRQGWTKKQILLQAQEIGLSFDQPHLKQFLEDID